MLVLQAILLGIVQGLTEFIPISSSAHLVIIPWALGWDNSALGSLSFDVSLHLGTLVALLAYFAKDWVRLVRAGVASVAERRIGEDLDRRMAWYIFIGCIPGGVIGLLFEHRIDQLFHPEGAGITTGAMVTMAAIIATIGGLLFLAERLARHARPLSGISLKDAMLVGIAQAMAVFPGVSRSGSTITAGLALGLEREAAARFSFLLSAPIIAGAGVRSLWKVIEGIRNGAIGSGDILLFPIGILVAAVSGYLCIKYLLQYLREHPTTLFVYYRWALAIFVVVLALSR